MLIVNAAANDLVRENVDVFKAYRFSYLDVSIITKQPTDSCRPLKHPGNVYRLMKFIHGAKKAGVVWGALLAETLKKSGLKDFSVDRWF